MGRKLSGAMFWLALAAVTGLYLALMRRVPLVFAGQAAFDDALFVKLAASLDQGHWLGRFDELTLSKGPFLSLWLAAASKSGLPLLFSESLLWALAGWLLVAWLRPRVRLGWPLLLLLAALLFQPLAYNLENLRVVREGLYAPLAALLLVSAAWWSSAQERSGWQAGLWAVLSGLVLAGLWLTREEAVEIVPALLVMALAAGLRSRDRARPVLSAALAAAVAIAGIGIVRWRNHKAYGVWDLVDLKQVEYRQAYGALSRVLPEPRQRHVPVSQQALATAAQASPAFGRLWPRFNAAWAERGCWMEGLEPCDGELRGGWFRFALRDAAARSGCYGSAASARDCYRRIADEVDSACAEGRLSCLPPRDSWVPPWRWSYLALTGSSLARAASTLVFLPGLDIRPGFSEDGKDSRLFAQLVGGPSFPLRDRWALKGEVVMDALLDAHAVFLSRQPSAFVTLQQAFAPLDRTRTHILLTLTSDCWDESCRLALQGRQGTLASLSAAQLFKGRRFDYGRLQILVHDLRRQDMPTGYDASRGERLFSRLKRLGGLYRVLLPMFLSAALVCYARRLVEAFRQRSLGLLAALSTALLTAILSRLALFSFIDATSWPAVNLLYFGPCYPLLVLFCGVTLLDYASEGRTRVKP